MHDRRHSEARRATPDRRPDCNRLQSIAVDCTRLLPPRPSARPVARGAAEIFQPLEKKFPIIGKIGPDFPTIGKKVSNHWKKAENFFQSLENRRIIFPIVGKTARFFSTIGKKVSNHWKTLQCGGMGRSGRREANSRKDSFRATFRRIGASCRPKADRATRFNSPSTASSASGDWPVKAATPASRRVVFRTAPLSIMVFPRKSVPVPRHRPRLWRVRRRVCCGSNPPGR